MEPEGVYTDLLEIAHHKTYRVPPRNTSGDPNPSIGPVFSFNQNGILRSNNIVDEQKLKKPPNFVAPVEN